MGELAISIVFMAVSIVRTTGNSDLPKPGPPIFKFSKPKSTGHGRKNAWDFSLATMDFILREYIEHFEIGYHKPAAYR